MTDYVNNFMDDMEVFNMNFPGKDMTPPAVTVTMGSDCPGCVVCQVPDCGWPGYHIWVPGPTGYVVCDFCEQWAEGDWDDQFSD